MSVALFRARPVSPPSAPPGEPMSKSSSGVSRLHAQLRGAPYRHPRQQSLAKAVASMTGTAGGAFLLETGDHVLTAGVSFLSVNNVLFGGDSPFATRLTRYDVEDEPMVSVSGALNGVDSIAIRGIAFTNNATSVDYPCLWVDDVTHVLIEDCTFNGGLRAIFIGSCVHVTVRCCRFYNYSTNAAVHIDANSARCRVEGCDFTASPPAADAAIYAEDGATYCTFSSNVPESSTGRVLSYRGIDGHVTDGANIGVVTVR